MSSLPSPRVQLEISNGTDDRDRPSCVGRAVRFECYIDNQMISTSQSINQSSNTLYNAPIYSEALSALQLLVADKMKYRLV